MRSLPVTTLTFVLLCNPPGANADGLKWDPIPFLTGGPWRLVEVPQGTLAINLGNIPSAAFRVAGSPQDDFVGLPLPPLQSSWNWPAAINEAVVAPDGRAYISCTTGVWEFDPAARQWEPTFVWPWDPSVYLTIVPNVHNITLVPNTSPPTYLIVVRVISFGSKSGPRMIQPGVNPNMVENDVRLDVRATQPRRLFYNDVVVAWEGYGHFAPGPEVPPVLFITNRHFSSDGGATLQQLQGADIYLASIPTAGSSWLLRDGHGEAHRFNGHEVIRMNFGFSDGALSVLSNESIISSREGAFRATSLQPTPYSQLAGASNPLSLLPNGTPAAVQWANSRLSVTPDRKVQWDMPGLLPADVEYAIEQSHELITWTTVSKSTGTTPTEWDQPGEYLYFNTTSSGRTEVSFYSASYDRAFFRMRVSSRP